jgi:hypothetical protein
VQLVFSRGQKFSPRRGESSPSLDTTARNSFLAINKTTFPDARSQPVITDVMHAREALRSGNRGAPGTYRRVIFRGRCPLLSAHESEAISSAERNDKGREKQANGTWLKTAILLPQRLSCYSGKTVSLRMLTNLTIADLRLTTTAQQRTTGQNLPSGLYWRGTHCLHLYGRTVSQISYQEDVTKHQADCHLRWKTSRPSARTAARLDYSETAGHDGTDKRSIRN